MAYPVAGKDWQKVASPEALVFVVIQTEIPNPNGKAEKYFRGKR
jgi:hypothetical protein